MIHHILNMRKPRDSFLLDHFFSLKLLHKSEECEESKKRDVSQK